MLRNIREIISKLHCNSSSYSGWLSQWKTTNRCDLNRGEMENWASIWTNVLSGKSTVNKLTWYCLVFCFPNAFSKKGQTRNGSCASPLSPRSHVHPVLELSPGCAWRTPSAAPSPLSFLCTELCASSSLSVQHTGKSSTNAGAKTRYNSLSC